MKHGSTWPVGSEIKMFDEDYRITFNGGQRGEVEYLSGEFASGHFYWEYQGEKAILLSIPEHDLVSVKHELPPLGTVVKCQLQHWHSKNIVDYDLIRVDEDDCDYRTADDECEISHDFNVIAWFKSTNNVQSEQSK